MIDIRYHAASLVAVFLALAIGILIGTSTVGTSSVEHQISRLKADFDLIQEQDRKVQAENHSLRQDLRILESALRQVVPAAVRGRLAGRRVAIILGGRPPDTSLRREVKFLLTTAGAVVPSITTVQENLLPENPNSRRILIEHAGLDPQDIERARRQLATRIVRDVLQGTTPDNVRLLARYSPGLVVDGDYSLPVDGVVLLAVVDNEEDERAMGEGRSVLARIADTLREQGVIAVACEPQDCAISLIPHFARHNLATVDGVDTPLGKIALVYALAGKLGHYGTKESATQVLPDLDVEPFIPSDAPPAHSLLPAPPAPAPQRESPPPGPGRSQHAPADR